MGLEDELEARYPVLRRPPGYGEAERLVDECLSLFKEAARVLSKHGVPTDTLVRRRPQPEGFFKRLAFDGRAKPVAEGWKLCSMLWVDTDGSPWATVHYVGGQDHNFEEVPLDVDKWVDEFAKEGEQFFSPDILVHFIKRNNEQGEPELFMEHPDVHGLGQTIEGPLKEVFLALVANLLRYRTK